jgi:hypothetical protein
MSAQFEAGQTVWLKIGTRPLVGVKVLEKLDGDMYRLDWAPSGFNPLLNSVRIPAKSIFTEPKE